MDTPTGDGYPAIAKFVASDPDHETYIFRRFNNLTARKLLYMQSELIQLEDRLATFDKDAANSNDPALQSSLRCWETFESKSKSCEPQKTWRALIDEIDVKLDRYQQALLLQSKVAQLERPPTRVLRAYKEVMSGAADGKGSKLSGKAQHLLEDTSDLAMLSPPTNKDGLSQFWLFKAKPNLTISGSTTAYFEEQSLTLLVNLCSTTIAALLLIGSILALYFVPDADARLGIVLAFIVLFAVGLSITTSASREGIFAATAAYSAVLIVYISGSTTNSLNGGANVAACNCTALT